MQIIIKNICMGNAMRGSATIDGKAWAPVTVAAAYQDGPNGLLLLSAVLYWISSRHCGKQKGAGGGWNDGQIELQDTALGIVCVRRLLALMNSHPSYKYIFEICICLPMRTRVRIWMRVWILVRMRVGNCEWLSEWATGNPICGCECYANKWNECRLRNDATYNE